MTKDSFEVDLPYTDSTKGSPLMNCSYTLNKNKTSSINCNLIGIVVDRDIIYDKKVQDIKNLNDKKSEIRTIIEKIQK